VLLLHIEIFYLKKKKNTKSQFLMVDNKKDRKKNSSIENPNGEHIL
jgi:hypothetical protein